MRHWGRAGRVVSIPLLLAGAVCFGHASIASCQAPDKDTSEAAARVLAGMVDRLSIGDAFASKVRQRVWLRGREVVGQGTYEQAGRGSGQFNLQVNMLDGDGQHALQQISDGRLAWTRQQIGDQLQLRRVDVGRLDQWVSPSASNPLLPLLAGETSPRPVLTSTFAKLPPSVRVGGFVEMIENIAFQNRLSLATGRLQEQRVWIVTADLTVLARRRIHPEGDDTWPVLCPTRTVIAIAQEDTPETRFGRGLPVRIEFYSDPLNEDDQVDESETPSESATRVPERQLISLLELHQVRPIDPPPVERFRFENQNIDFVNETDRYLNRYGIELTNRQSRTLRR
ncbi:MAG: hypothetical protein AAGD07_01320 [Planctomycetota bacterium]